MIGIEEKDMIINRIPAKTWNHLHMNQSKVGEVVINRTGELNASVNDVSLIDDGKLNNGELEKELQGNDFIRIHQSYLVNMKHIEKVSRYEALLNNGIKLEIPKARYKFVEETFVSYKGEI